MYYYVRVLFSRLVSGASFWARIGSRSVKEKSFLILIQDFFHSVANSVLISDMQGDSKNGDFRDAI